MKLLKSLKDKFKMSEIVPENVLSSDLVHQNLVDFIEKNGYKKGRIMWEARMFIIANEDGTQFFSCINNTPVILDWSVFNSLKDLINTWFDKYKKTLEQVDEASEEEKKKALKGGKAAGYYI